MCQTVMSEYHWIAVSFVHIANFISIHVCTDLLVPTLPTQDAVRAWIYNEMQKKGLVWDLGGAKVDPGRLLRDVIAEPCVKDADGNFHIQVMADGVKVFRNNMVTNVGIRALDRSNDFNSLTGIRLL